MEPTGKMVAAMRLVTQADATYSTLRRAWYAAFHADDTVRMDRLDGIRLRALARLERRNEAYRVLVYGGATMTARYAIRGTIAPRSQPRRMTVAGAVVEPTRTPIVAQLTPLGAALAELLASGVEPCPVCNRYGCDCDEWHEIMFTDPMNPDPHGDLRALQAMEIPV
jgi:hypothetical protein